MLKMNKCKSCKEVLIKGDNQQNSDEDVCVVCVEHYQDYDNEYMSYYE